MKKTKAIFALSFLLSLSACENFFLPEPGKGPEEIFDELWHTFNEEYAPFEERGVDWEQQYNIYRPMVTPETSNDQLFTIISQLLSTLNDGHVSLTAPGREVFFSNRIRRLQTGEDLFSLTLIKENYLEPGFSVGDGNSYVFGKIKNHNLAYIFFDFIGPQFSVLANFTNRYSEVDGFIIDLRHNKGGDFTYSLKELGIFTQQKRLAFLSKTKNGPGKDDYTSWHSWFIKPSGNYVQKPLVVLTDRFTISAGERTAMALKILPEVFFVGDTTNGSIGTMIGRELANGWYFSLVPQKVIMGDGQSYEGKGLAPDLPLKNKPEDIARGIDSTIETGIRMFMNTLSK